MRPRRPSRPLDDDLTLLELDRQLSSVRFEPRPGLARELYRRLTQHEPPAVRTDPPAPWDGS